MVEIVIKIPGIDDQQGDSPIIILGPNGSGKTRLAQSIAGVNEVAAISAQRRTWVDDSLPVQSEQQLRTNVRSYQDQWRTNAWQTTEEFNWVLSQLVQDHTTILTERNAEAVAAGHPLPPVEHTNLIRLQGLWGRLFPARKLEILGFFPKVKRLDTGQNDQPYHLREMSDGERTVLYMAARVLTSDKSIILVDEPELHMHSRLAVQFWNEAERLRPDCRFIYITHDLNFALSRRRATVLIARANSAAESILVEDLPSSVAPEILGAATLPFFAKRIFFFEGENDTAFASDFLNAWLSDDETFAIPAGNRDSVCASVTGLKKAGIAAGEVLGLVDRDFYPDSINDSLPEGITVLPLHEIESVLCDSSVVSAIACHLGKDPKQAWDQFLNRTQEVFTGKTLNSIIANRVRARVGDLLDGAFSGAQISTETSRTCENHCAQLSDLDLPARTATMFKEEEALVRNALNSGRDDMLVDLPGKHLLSLLPDILGLKSTSELTTLVVRAIDQKAVSAVEKEETGESGKGTHMKQIAIDLEIALKKYLPSRKASTLSE